MEEFDKAIKEIDEKYDNGVISDIRSGRKGRKTVMFGAGELGHKVYNVLKDRGLSVHYFCDNFLKGNLDQRTGLQIIGMEELPEEKAGLLMLIAVFDDDVSRMIYMSLLNIGFLEEQLINVKKLGDMVPLSHLKENIGNYKDVYSFLGDDYSKKVYLKRIQRAYLNIDISSVVTPGAGEYFDKQVVLTEEETFIDCGGYVGDTAINFINRTHGKYKNIVIFEPEDSKTELIRKNMGNYKYSLYQCGVWNCNAVLKFEDRGNMGSCISEKGGVEIEVQALDDIVYKEAPTFIKMDIEGAEENALLGTTKIIKNFRPKLAVCIYHKPDDLFRIPLLIRKLRGDYKILIRQYHNSRNETVCYAV